MASWPLTARAPGLPFWIHQVVEYLLGRAPASRRRSRPTDRCCPVLLGLARHPAGGHRRRAAGRVPPRPPAAAPRARRGDGGRHRAWSPSCSATTSAPRGCVFATLAAAGLLGLLLRTDYRPKRRRPPGRARTGAAPVAAGVGSSGPTAAGRQPPRRPCASKADAASPAAAAGRRPGQGHHDATGNRRPRRLARHGQPASRPRQAARLLERVGAGRDPAGTDLGQPEDPRPARLLQSLVDEAASAS